jgi:phosphatidylglycerophosphate synthase
VKSDVRYTVEDVRAKGKRELFRAGPRMRFVMPRISVRVTQWTLNHLPSTTPNEVTAVSAMLGVAAGVLLVPTGWAWALASFVVYQAHILTDYVDGEIARVRSLASVRGAYFDLMVGRVVKPVVLYGAAIGSWLAHRQATDADLDLLLGAFIVAGFLLDKEAVDVWYRVNSGRGEIEDPYAIRSDHALTGWRRVVVRVIVGLRSIPAFLGYQLAAGVAWDLGVHTIWTVNRYQVTPRSLILIVYAAACPLLALARAIYIARTGHIPRRQDLVRDEGGVPDD